MIYWNVTTSFLYDTLPAFSQAIGSKLLGSLLFSIFLIQFIFPLLGLRFFKYLLHLTFQSPASNLETLIRGVVNGIIGLLFFLCIASLIHYLEFDGLKNLLPEFTVMFQGARIIPVPAEASMAYKLITMLPIAFAQVIPDFFVKVIVFAKDIPILAILVVTTSIVFAFWEKTKTMLS